MSAASSPFRPGHVRWALALHGGAKTLRADTTDLNRAGCLAALLAGESILRAGGAALDAAMACVKALEDDATFNAGYGSVLNADGEVEMDAAIMDGRTLDVGAVCAIMGVTNPVAAARALLREPPILLAGAGARRFAERAGAELCDPRAMIAPRRDNEGGAHDTVGCVARDAAGDVAVAMSTGGLRGKMPGRVGDTPLPGAGYYAKNGVGAVAFSGEGEAIARLALAAWIMERLADGTAPQEAAAAAIARLGELGATGGVLVMSGDGRLGWAHNTPDFPVALAAWDAEPRVVLRREDAKEPSAG